MRNYPLRLSAWAGLALSLAITAASPGDDFGDLARLDPLRPRSERETDEVNAATLVMQARILEQRGDYVPALRKYQRAWRLDPGARVLLKQIVPLALNLGRVEEATRYSLLLTNSDLQDPFLAERLAMLMADQLEYDRSLKLYQHVLQLRVNEPETRDPIGMHFEMGRLYFLTNKFKQAAQSFRVVLDALENPEKHQLPAEVRDAILANPRLVYSLIAESFLEAGEYEAARILFTKAAATSETPADDWMEFQNARVDYRAGKYREAREKLERYIQQKLKFGGRTPYELLQSVLERSRPEDENAEKQGVIARFRDWLSDDPDNFPLLSYVADLNRRKGTLQDAADLYVQSLETQPTLEGFGGLLATFRELKDTTGILDTLVRVTSAVNSLDPVADELAAMANTPKLLDDVFELGRKRIEEDSDTRVAAACGLLAVQTGRHELAEEFLGKIETDPERIGLLESWGTKCLFDGEHACAIRVLQKALKFPLEDSERGVMLYYLAGALQLAGRTEDAMTAARQATKLSGDIPDVAIRPAWIQYTAGDYAAAEAAYNRWLGKYAEDYSLPGLRESVRDARFVLSDICLQDERYGDAIEWLERVLDEFPRDVGASNDLGYLLVDQGRSLERATRMIRFAVEAEPDNPAYRDSLGWSLYRQGKFDEAVVELQNAASHDTPDPIILDHLAEALVATGDGLGAVEAWQKALLRLSSIDDVEELRGSIRQKIQRHVAESK